jgi:5'-methylthioadenosine phosphorylase
VRVGLISGSGSEEWPGLDNPERRTVTTQYGQAEITDGVIAGVPVVHLSRHGAGHARLSNHVQHRANLAALLDAEIDCLVSLTLCGAVNPAVPPGSLIVFDDLYFPGNRLPDGRLCTWHDEPGAAGRGHWIADAPYSEPLRRALLAAARRTGHQVASSGCYGHVAGPRFNTRTEVAALAQLGVAAISQTAGPEVVLAGEAELPMALLGFVTDYATGVAEHPESVEALHERLQASGAAFAAVIEQALPTLHELSPAGIVYRFEP